MLCYAMGYAACFGVPQTVGIEIRRKTAAMDERDELFVVCQSVLFYSHVICPV